MKRCVPAWKAVWLGTLAVCSISCAANAGEQSREEFDRLVKATYDFDVTHLSTKQKMRLEKTVGEFWTKVSKRKTEFLPYLRSALEGKSPLSGKANVFFRFDGSNLLVQLDPSQASKALQVKVYTGTDLDVVGAERWLVTLVMRGVEGHDVSAAGSRWMTDPKAHFVIPEHGDYAVDNPEGAMFLFCSMNEAQATPVLIRLANRVNFPQRELALYLLAQQLTAPAMEALKKVNTTGLSEEAKANLKELQDSPPVIEPREKPRITREEFLKAFDDIIKKKDNHRFLALVDKAEDGEHDAVAVLKPEDVPTIRQVRRYFMLYCNQHGLSYYQDFTRILWTLTQEKRVTYSD